MANLLCAYTLVFPQQKAFTQLLQKQFAQKNPWGGLWAGSICISFNSSTSCLPTSTFIRVVFPSQFPSARRSLSFCQLYASPETLLSEELFLAWQMEDWLLSLSVLARTSFVLIFHTACGFFLWHFTNNSKIFFLSTQVRQFRKGVIVSPLLYSRKKAVVLGLAIGGQWEIQVMYFVLMHCNTMPVTQIWVFFFPKSAF